MPLLTVHPIQGGGMNRLLIFDKCTDLPEERQVDARSLHKPQARLDHSLQDPRLIPRTPNAPRLL